MGGLEFGLLVSFTPHVVLPMPFSARALRPSNLRGAMQAALLRTSLYKLVQAVHEQILTTSLSRTIVRELSAEMQTLTTVTFLIGNSNGTPSLKPTSVACRHSTGLEGRPLQPLGRLLALRKPGNQTNILDSRYFHARYLIHTKELLIDPSFGKTRNTNSKG